MAEKMEAMASGPPPESSDTARLVCPIMSGTVAALTMGKPGQQAVVWCLREQCALWHDDHCGLR